MPSINPNRYPLDYTGEAITNLVSAERVTLAARKVRSFAPQNAPYFAKNIVIKDLDSGLILTPTQYKCFNLISAPSAIAGIGNEVYAIVVILDQTVGNDLEVTYQTIGGDYVAGYDSIVSMLDALTQDNRPALWDNILNRPQAFQINQHLHSLDDSYGWEYLCAALEQVMQAFILGDDVKKDFILQYIDNQMAASNAAANVALSPTSPFGAHITNTNNPHNVTPTQLGLGNVQNYPIADLNTALAGTSTTTYMTTSLVTAVVKNAVNLGMDAHISNFNNPHNVTAAQLGLDKVQNLPLAAQADFTTLDPNNPKYVTNNSFATWWATFTQAQATSLASQVSTVMTNVQVATTTAESAQTAAQSAQTQAENASSQTTQAVALATQALTVAQQNTQTVASSQSAAQTLIQQYLVAAVAAAETAGYSRGYAAGVASIPH